MTSPYHLEARGSLRAADAGQPVCAGWTSPVGASAVAAFSCCKAAGLCVPKPASRVSSRSRFTPDRPAIRRLPVFAGVHRWAVPIVTHLVYLARARDRVGTVCESVSRIWPIAGGHPARHNLASSAGRFAGVSCLPSRKAADLSRMNDRDPAITAAIPTASSPASGCRRPRLLRRSGIWARRSRRYWLRAAGMDEDGIGGRVSLVAADGERENFHRSARASPATRRHAGHFTRCHDIAGHSLTL